MAESTGDTPTDAGLSAEAQSARENQAAVCLGAVTDSSRRCRPKAGRKPESWWNQVFAFLVARLDVGGGELQHTVDCVSQLSLHNHLRAPNSMVHSMRIYCILTGVRTT